MAGARVRFNGVASDTEIPTPPSGKCSVFYDKTNSVMKAKLDNGSVVLLSVNAEFVQDVVGSFFQDSSTIDVTYNDVGNIISAEVVESALDPNQIPVVPTGGLTSSNVQDAFEELQTEIENIVITAVEVAQDAFGAMIAAGVQDGIAVAYNDAGNAVNFTNTDKGSVAVTDHEAASNPHPQYTTAAEASAAAPVQSVNGQTGNVVLTTTNIAEGTNQYFTESRVRSTLLTGLSLLTGGIIAVTDSVLIAFGKIQKQVTDNLTALSNHIADLANPHNVTKSQVGLGNVDNTSDINKPISTATQTALNLKEDLANKGAANGYAPLDSNSLIPTIYIPGSIDDVLEYANLAAFPVTGISGKMYVAIDTGKVYRWSGSIYVEISASPGSTDAVPEGVSNLYFTENRVRATVLTGITFLTNSAIVAADSVLIAFGKLQAQVTDLLSTKADKTTTVSAGTGLTGGGDLSANRTIAMPNVGTAGSVGAADSTLTVTTDAQGRVSSVVSNLISIISSQGS